jgi:hypothetical protein
LYIFLFFSVRRNTDDGDDNDDDDEEEEEEGDFGSSASDVLSETGSAKNMADFEDMSESEQKQQTTAARRMRINHQLAEVTSSTPTDRPSRKRHESEQNVGSQTSSSSSTSSSAESTNGSSPGAGGGAGNDDDEINISNLSSPGQTLLWDLLQDQINNNSSHLPDTLLNETERLFGQVLSLIEDKRILLHFIQACLDNLKKSTSSLISLRLLPKLFLIFQQQQRTNTSIFLSFEEKYHVLNVFFNDLEQLTKRLQINNPSISIHNEITVRFQFLSFIFSISATPKEFSKLTGKYFFFLRNSLHRFNTKSSR